MAAQAAPLRLPPRGDLTRLTGLLSFYDEEPWYLTECVASLAATVDHLVVVDGRYRRYPRSLPRSPREQLQAVRSAAAGVPLTLHVPDEPYPNEIAKRRFMFELAREVSPGGWLLVVDADERVVGVSRHLRRRLAETSRDAAEVRFWTVRDLVYQESMRRLFRSLPDLTVKGRHCRYVAGGRRLWGDGELVPAFDATKLLAIEHRCGIRTRHREEARRRSR